MKQKSPPSQSPHGGGIWNGEAMKSVDEWVTAELDKAPPPTKKQRRRILAILRAED